MWRSTLWMNLINDESSTNYKLKRKEEKKIKMKNVKEYLRLKMQKVRSALNVLHEMLCSSQSKQLSFRSSLIISRKLHHFSMRRETSMTRAFDDVFPWFRNEWDIRHNNNNNINVYLRLKIIIINVFVIFCNTFNAEI